MKRGRLWMIASRLPIHTPGGREQVVAEMVRGLAARGWRIDLVTPRLPGAVELPPGVTLHALDAPAGIPTHRFGAALVRWGVAQTGPPPDLLFCVTFACAGLVAQRREIPALFQAHGSSWAEATSKLRAGDPRGLFRLWLYLRAERRTLTLYDRIVVVGPAVRAHYAGRSYRFLDPRRIVEIPNGIDLTLLSNGEQRRQRARADLGIGPGERIVLCAGRLIRQKGVLDLLRACTRLPQLERERICVLIAGSGRDEPALRTYAAEHRLTRVAFLGQLPRARLLDLTLAADLVVQAGAGAEGLPLTVLEALCAGCPVLISERMSLPPFGGEQAVYRVAPGDTAAIIAGLRRALAEGAPRDAVARAAQQRFSLSGTFDAYERLMAEMIAERGGQGTG